MRLAVPWQPAILIALASCSCGGNSSGSSGMSGPSSTNATTITIQSSNGLSNLGAQSFSPNPATASQGSQLVWRNADTTMHHIVLDDGSLDTGDIGPGTSSPAKTLNTAAAQYHCTIHPTMVGSINTATSSSPSMGSGYLTPGDRPR